VFYQTLITPAAGEASMGRKSGLLRVREIRFVRMSRDMYVLLMR